MKRTPDKVVLRLYDEKYRLLHFHTIKTVYTRQPRKGLLTWWTLGRGPLTVTYTPPTTTHVARATLAADSMAHVFGHPLLVKIPDFRATTLRAESTLTLVFGSKKDGKKQPLFTLR